MIKCMDTKQIALLVSAVTAIVNVILFTGGFTTTLTCTVANKINTVFAQVVTH